MDAFFAAVEVRDNPELAGKPLIIGALPHERGVVSTCSYEAREFGVRSAMSIKEAYRRCPEGIYMHPNMSKYAAVSDKIHEIWGAYTDLVEYISLDEGYLDVTGSADFFGGAYEIATEIRRRTRDELGLTCSVGIGYSMMTAKLASEEKKPDGLFEIPDAAFFRELVAGRDIRVIYGVGKVTAEKLRSAGISRVRDILEQPDAVRRLLGKHGEQIVSLAGGRDTRQVTPDAEAKSIGREHTFQTDITDRQQLRDTLLLIAKDLSLKLRLEQKFCRTVTLKVTFPDMRQITRSRSGPAMHMTEDIFGTAVSLLDSVEKRAIRLIGISLSNLTDSDFKQLSLEEMDHGEADGRKEALEDALLGLHKKYGAGIIKTASELAAQRHFKTGE